MIAGEHELTNDDRYEIGKSRYSWKKLPNYGIVIYKDALQQLKHLHYLKQNALDNDIMENQYFNTQHVLYIA